MCDKKRKYGRMQIYDPIFLSTILLPAEFGMSDPSPKFGCEILSNAYTHNFTKTMILRLSSSIELCHLKELHQFPKFASTFKYKHLEN